MRFQRWISGLLLSCLASLACGGNLELITYYHTDHLGSPVAATDERGELLWREQYRPYGERYGEPSAKAPTVGYTGHMQDDAAGLVYAGARYHDPVVGRFLAVDPVGVVPEAPVSFNRYSYAANSPYRFVDPDGRWAEDAVLATTSIALSSYSFGKNIEAGNYGWAAVDVGAIVLDAAAILVPMVPGVVGITVQGGRAVSTTAASTSDDLVDVYRAVGPAELSDIQRTGAFNSPPGLEGKYFTTSAEQAANYSRMAVRQFKDEPYTIVKSQVSNRILSRPGIFAEVDGGIPAYVIPNENLGGMMPEVMNYSPIP